MCGCECCLSLIPTVCAVAMCGRHKCVLACKPGAPPSVAGDIANTHAHTFPLADRPPPPTCPFLNTHKCTRIYVCIHKQTRLQTHTHTHTHAGTYTPTHPHNTHTRTHMQMYIHTHAYNTHTHIDTHTWTETHTHTHINDVHTEEKKSDIEFANIRTHWNVLSGATSPLSQLTHRECKRHLKAAVAE